MQWSKDDSNWAWTSGKVSDEVVSLTILVWNPEGGVIHAGIVGYKRAF